MDGLLALEKSLKANKNTSNTPKSKASSLDTAAANSFGEEGTGEAESEVPSEDSVASELDEEVGECDRNGEEKLVGEKLVSMGNQSFGSDHKESGEGGGRRKRKRKHRRNEWVGVCMALCVHLMDEFLLPPSLPPSIPSSLPQSFATPFPSSLPSFLLSL